MNVVQYKRDPKDRLVYINPRFGVAEGWVDRYADVPKLVMDELGVKPKTLFCSTLYAGFVLFVEIGDSANEWLWSAYATASPGEGGCKIGSGDASSRLAAMRKAEFAAYMRGGRKPVKKEVRA
jgi:hypothetical protein